jgi:hypothetical protein
MLVFSFIVGLVSGASLGIILLSLVVAGKKKCPEPKIKHAAGAEEVKTIPKGVVQC